MDFLSEIIAVKRQRVAEAKERWPLSLDVLRTCLMPKRADGFPHAFKKALERPQINLIAEFKRRSPSKGKISSNASPVAIARTYELAGAAAISVLTEEDHFGGSLGHLRRIREITRLPVLRKDFIIDEYQVYESAFSGADALLLIVAALNDEELKRLRIITEDEFGMDALIEVHTKDELERAVACGARIIGVNNRDLGTFEVSVETSYQLAQVAPTDAILVSESGLSPPEVRKLRDVGYQGFLVGEALMRAPDPAQAVREFIGEPEAGSQSVLVKICGITNLEDARAAVAAGADMLGFNFYPCSPRFIEPDAAQQIISTLRSEMESDHQSVKVVGVFVNQTLFDVGLTAESVGLDGIQLHGDEKSNYCRFFKRGDPCPLVIKVIPDGAPLDWGALSRYPVDAFMVDASDPSLRGGTGRTADWTLAREAARQLPRLFLAGGLSPENVGEAIATVRPYAVDACSALELSPGKKDHARMKEFVAAVRAVKLPDEVSASQ
ncbi:MAG: indole-3-glycerol phosphate synthase TrpC [Pyrinomonadaceae bacterium]